jgi:hypothetical protein
MNHPLEPIKVPDPLIDEVRAIRKAISDQFGNDVRRLGDHLRKLEQSHPGRIIRIDRSIGERTAARER